MNRNLYLKSKRQQLIKQADKDVIKAANQLIEQAEALKHCKTSQDRIFALSQIFCVSESTIEKDLYSD